jgi:thiaminase
MKVFDVYAPDMQEKIANIKEQLNKGSEKVSPDEIPNLDEIFQK